MIELCEILIKIRELLKKEGFHLTASSTDFKDKTIDINNDFHKEGFIIKIKGIKEGTK